ncbi:MAG: CvpA family protein [Burkholderiales bacterium]
MTIFDLAVVLIIGLSLLLSVIRGAVREVLALTAWVAAFWAAQAYAVEAAALMPGALSNPSLRLMTGFAVIFLTVLVIMSLLAMVCSRFVKATSLSAADRALGAVFGLLRGYLMVVILVLLGGLTSLPKQPQWKDALFSSSLERVAVYIKTWLPENLAKRITYS